MKLFLLALILFYIHYIPKYNFLGRLLAVVYFSHLQERLGCFEIFLTLAMPVFWFMSLRIRGKSLGIFVAVCGKAFVIFIHLRMLSGARS